VLQKSFTVLSYKSTFKEEQINDFGLYTDVCGPIGLPGSAHGDQNFTACEKKLVTMRLVFLYNHSQREWR